MERIVVGIDGSSHAEHALHWAIRQAQLTGATVDAVAVHTSPAQMYALPMEAVVYTGVTPDDLEKATRELLDQTIARVASGTPVEVVPIVVQGSPAAALRECAKGADLVVVGTHGYGAIRGAIVGSVTQRLLHNPPCPVVAVPLHEDAG